MLGLLTTASYVALFALVPSEPVRTALEPVVDEAVAGFNEGAAAAQGSTTLFQPGDCLDVDVADSEDFRLDQATVVECAVPHAAEYAGGVTMPEAPGATYPGEDEVFSGGVDHCLDVFVEHAGVELGARPELDLFIVYPLELTWRALDDRAIECLVVNVDGSSLQGPIGS